ncbi:glycosyltransferase [Verrucosispora sp. TAA-831]|uniref:glycosyltransferase n=1 Tax=Verrucosispora sp. TAA-831 TaxID=3422227 RepID=UPI003D6E7524
MTHGLHRNGGVGSVVNWLYEGLTDTGRYAVDVHDLATSVRDAGSRRLLAPRSWRRASLLRPSDTVPHERYWGANAVEVEVMRYRPRQELTRALAGYDCIQVVCGTPAWAAPVLSAGPPVVVQMATLVAWERAHRPLRPWHPADLWRAAMTRLTSRIERSALGAADAVLVENHVILDWAVSLGLSGVLLAPPGVDTARFTPSPSGWRADGYLLSVCRLGDPRKGLDRMVRAYAEALRRRPDLPPLVLAGKGRLAPGVTDLVAQLGLGERVRVRPDVPADDLVELFRGASVFLQTSYEEGLGLSAVEAMACGLPTVLTATHGAVECVADGRTGWLVPLEPADEVSATVAARILDILDVSGPAMAEAARRRCECLFSRSAALSRFTDTYDRLLADRTADR